MQSKTIMGAALAAISLTVPAFAASPSAGSTYQEMSSPRYARMPIPTWAAAGLRSYGDTGMTYEKAIEKIYGKSAAARLRNAATQVKTPKTPTGPYYQGSGDYLDEMLASGAEHWSQGRFPLRVFIAGGGGAGYRNNFPQIFASSMNEWSSASGGKISWTQVSDPNSADITVQWQPTVSGPEPEAGATRTSHVPGSGGRLINRAHISIVSTQNGANVSDGEMKKICLHEIGHALGLRHSSTPGDIMFWQSNGAQVAAIGTRDASTISRLYGGN